MSWPQWHRDLDLSSSDEIESNCRGAEQA